MTNNNQTERVSDEELDQMIWKLERDGGMTPKMLSLMRELREVRRAKGDGRDQFEEWFKFHHGEEGSIVTLHRANGGANYADPHVDLAWIAWKDSRTAMLNHSGDTADMVEPVSNRDELPATQFKPVADLYGITSPTGSETSFTFDAIEAANFIEGGWSVQEYVELERYQEAMISNSPATPDGWVMVPVEPTPEMRDAYHNAQEEYESVDGLWSPDHQWKAMIAAAPKEVG